MCNMSYWQQNRILKNGMGPKDSLMALLIIDRSCCMSIQITLTCRIQTKQYHSIEICADRDKHNYMKIYIDRRSDLSEAFHRCVLMILQYLLNKFSIYSYISSSQLALIKSTNIK